VKLPFSILMGWSVAAITKTFAKRTKCTVASQSSYKVVTDDHSIYATGSVGNMINMLNYLELS